METVTQPNSSDWPMTPDALLAFLEENLIETCLHHHEPLFTVEDAEKIDATIPGTHCRNLFLRDKKKQNYLVVLRNETELDIKKLEYLLHSARLSFGSAERLWEFLGVKPGSVCPFAAINDVQGGVRLILEKDMMDEEVLCFHPLLNTMTVAIKPADLRRFFKLIGREDVEELDLKPSAP
ncbi:MAG: prolyl-tRNA synthetase associated domain-containing protein [Pseudobdellovibrionaceae bacterium]